MLVIAEGVDGGGKSTLIKQLDTYYKEWCLDHGHQAEVLHFKKNQPEQDRNILEQYELDLEQSEVMSLILSPTALVLCDRWHVGEMIYGPIYRGESRLSDAMNLHVELFLDAIGALKLLAQPGNITVVRTRLKKRGEDFLQPEHVKEVYDAYEVHGSHYGYLRPSMFQGSEMKPIDLIELAHLRTDVATDKASISTMPTYVGHPTPTTLFVGDQRNDGPGGDLRWPRAFTPWQATGSSLYLMTTLHRTNVHRSGPIGIVNANEPDVNLERIHNLETQPAVVALGSNASAALMRAGVEHERVPHPQWYRRFRYHDMAGYVTAIKTAAGVA